MKTQTKSTRRSFLARTAGALAAGASVGGIAAESETSPAASVRARSVLADVEVLVVGGGPAGLGAAIAAARHGAKTLLIENHAFFGGVASWCLGMPMNQMRPGGKPRSVVHELLIDRLAALGSQAVRFGQHELFCNVDYLKVAAFDALDAVSCGYLVAIRAVDTLVKGNRVVGVTVATKNGLAEIHAKTVVDCSGDGDVAFYAGAETMKEVGQLSPMTLCLNLTNVPKEQVIKGNMREVAQRGRGKYPLIPEGWGLSSVGNSESGYFINHAGTKRLGQFDATDPAERTRAECLSRRQAVQMTEAMREFGGEELAKIELIGTGPQLGVRETRRVKGLYTLTEEDAKTGRRFDDVIAWRSGFLDIGFVRYERMKIHDVPYRALVPETVDGLLVAGRCISATHVGAAAGKSMGNCMATGHAAGLAAALCVRGNHSPRELKVEALQAALRKDGVDLEGMDREQTGLR